MRGPPDDKRVRLGAYAHWAPGAIRPPAAATVRFRSCEETDGVPFGPTSTDVGALTPAAGVSSLRVMRASENNARTAHPGDRDGVVAGQGASRRRRASVRGRLARFHRAEEATSDVEYVLLTAMVVLPLFVLPFIMIRANRDVFGRVSHWTHLPYP